MLLILCLTGNSTKLLSFVNSTSVSYWPLQFARNIDLVFLSFFYIWNEEDRCYTFDQNRLANVNKVWMNSYTQPTRVRSDDAIVKYYLFYEASFFCLYGILIKTVVCLLLVSVMKYMIFFFGNNVIWMNQSHCIFSQTLLLL